jgi:hypothetical protein
VIEEDGSGLEMKKLSALFVVLSLVSVVGAVAAPDRKSYCQETVSRPAIAAFCKGRAKRDADGGAACKQIAIESVRPRFKACMAGH